MPELPLKPPVITELSHTVANAQAEHHFHGEPYRHPMDIAKELTDQYGQETVGIGTFRVVIPHPTDPEHKVVGIDYWTTTNPEQAKSYYHSHQILHTLFPQNFPAIHASHATIDDPESPHRNQPSSTVRERVTPATPTVEAPYPKNINRKGWRRALHWQSRNNKHITAPFHDAKKICEELGIHFKNDVNYPGAPGNFDPENPNNFIVGKNGGEYYIEPVSIDTDLPLDSERIENYMREKHYSDADIQTVRRGIQRLTSISQQ